MNRVSTDQLNNDFQYSMRRQEARLGSLENKISSQRKIENLRDDPIAAAHSVRYQSYLARLDRFEQNAQYLQDNNKIAEGYMRQSVDILQRLREIAVQGGQGTISKEDLSYMGTEVNELLSELVNLGNAKGPDGGSLFAGSRVETEAFATAEGTVPGAPASLVVSVEYRGDSRSNLAEITDGRYIEANQAGNEVFWAERQQVYSSVDGRDYRVGEDTAIRINGRDIEIKTGDNVAAIVAKINDAGAGVKASLDPAKASLVLEGTSARKLDLADAPGGSVLRDLGILGDGTTSSGYSPSARVSGGSMFDAAIRLSDSLFKGDVVEVGGQGIQGIDSALNSLNAKVTELGARTERLEKTIGRFDREIPDVTGLLASEQDLDFTKAVTDMKMAEYTRQAAMGAAGKLLQPTLLDFLQ
jgi:flagellar hook-associated protein 3 FlgL